MHLSIFLFEAPTEPTALDIPTVPWHPPATPFLNSRSSPLASSSFVVHHRCAIRSLQTLVVGKLQSKDVFPHVHGPTVVVQGMRVLDLRGFSQRPQSEVHIQLAVR
jgi:hypothetical protein